MATFLMNAMLLYQYLAFFQEVQYNLAALSSGSAHKCICYAHRHLCMSLLSVESQVEEPSKAMDAPSSQPLEVKMI